MRKSLCHTGLFHYSRPYSERRDRHLSVLELIPRSNLGSNFVPLQRDGTRLVLEGKQSSTSVPHRPFVSPLTLFHNHTDSHPCLASIETREYAMFLPSKSLASISFGFTLRALPPRRLSRNSSLTSWPGALRGR